MEQSVKMNTEQKQLVIDNHKLIYGFLVKNKLDANEWYGICALAVCKVSLIYDFKRPFSTLAYTAMKNAVFATERARHAQLRTANLISLDSEVRVSDHGKNILLSEIISDDCNDVFSDLEVLHIYQEWYDSLKPREKTIIDMKMQNKNHVQIAEKLGISSSAVSYISQLLQFRLKGALK